MHSSLLVIFLVLCQSAIAQTIPATASPPNYGQMDFATLRDVRSRLVYEIESAQDQLSTLQKSIDARTAQTDDVKTLKSAIDGNKIEIAKLTTQLDVEKGRKSPNQAILAGIQEKVNADKQAVSGLEEKVKVAEQELVARTELRKTIDVKQQEKSALEAQIDTKLQRDIASQDFKTKISLLFSGLVAIVILGFFFVAYYDEGVRKAIFGGNSGIQFVTLFSLVIAIILFGLTGILQDKELAALLGGLSGYILGRGLKEA